MTTRHVCGRKVWTATSTAGARVVLDPEPVTGRPGWAPVLEDGQRRVRATPRPGRGQRVYPEHVCPDDAPVCGPCGTPMPADLAAREGWQAHPTCHDHHGRAEAIRLDREAWTSPHPVTCTCGDCYTGEEAR